MKKAVGAVLFHCTDIDNEEMRHRYCPSTRDSWCKWQTDRINGTQHYTKRVDLPVAIKEVLYPIFKELSSDELLSKCLHGLTQNANESLQSMIWDKCPKNTFLNKRVLEIGIFSAVIEFNDGQTGLMKVVESLGMESGSCMLNGYSTPDRERIAAMSKKESESAKKRRRHLRSV